MIKKILLSFGIVVLAAGIAGGVLYFIKPPQAKPNQETPAPKLVLDHSKDYGACTMFETSQIKSILGDPAENLQDPQDMGIASNKAIGPGVDDLVSDSQRCVYAFTSGGTLENSFNAGNGLTIERIVFTNDAGPKSLIEQVKANPEATSVDGLGDAAYYNGTAKAVGPNASYTYRLETFTGDTSIRYIIREPANKAAFDIKSAKAALVELAKLAK